MHRLREAKHFDHTLNTLHAWARGALVGRDDLDDKWLHVWALFHFVRPLRASRARFSKRFAHCRELHKRWSPSEAASWLYLC